MRFIVVTGMSGAGKSTALKILEDYGFFCVDNLPIKLLEQFALWAAEKEEDKGIALGVDVRSGDEMKDLSLKLRSREVSSLNPEILFLDASDESLMKRFKETRRNHPFEKESDGIEEAINLERKRLQSIRSEAKFVVDTSHLLTRDLRHQLDEIILQGKGYKNLNIKIVSFGFKYGTPADADLMFDVRFLPNPFYVPELRDLTGNDRPVAEFVMASQVTADFLFRLTDMIRFLLPHYVDEGKNQLVIAVGCTGGRHRSVTIANELYASLSGLGYGLKLEHREI